MVKITAKEARDLVEDSDKTLNKYLDKAYMQIRVAATSGEKSVVLTDFSTSVIHGSNSNEKVSQIQQRVIKALAIDGFRARFETIGNPYIPRGHPGATGDENDVKYINFGIVVTW